MKYMVMRMNKILAMGKLTKIISQEAYIDEKDDPEMDSLGYSRETRDFIARPKFQIAMKEIIKIYKERVRKLLRAYHTDKYIKEFDRKIEKCEKRKTVQYLRSDIAKEVPITLQILREHLFIAEQVERALDTFGKFKIHKIQNLYPTHHASEGKAQGYCLFNWRNVLVMKLHKAGIICGGMDIDIHASGNTTSGIFTSDWSKGARAYHHYLDVTSTDVYPYKFEVKKDELYCKGKMMPHELVLALDGTVKKDNRGKRCWVHYCESTNTRQIVFEAQFSPKLMVQIVDGFNEKRVELMRGMYGDHQIMDICHIGVDAASGDDIGNQNLTEKSFSILGQQHRKYCENNNIGIVYFNEGGYRKRGNVSPLFKHFYGTENTEGVSRTQSQQVEKKRKADAISPNNKVQKTFYGDQ